MTDLLPRSPADRSGYLKIGLTAFAVLAAVALAVGLAVRCVDQERERDLRAWQTRLGIVADSRAAAVSAWVGSQFTELSGLAENASLQLYMTELTLGEIEPDEVPAEADYLRNLLIVTADRAGYTGRVLGPEVAANVDRVGVAGMALLDGHGRVLVATPRTPPIEGRLAEFVTAAPRGERAFLDLWRGPAGQPTVAFLVPVFGIQADAVASEQIGMVLGVREIGADLYDRLIQPGATDETGESLLVRISGAVVEYLSPLADGSAPLERRLAHDTPELAAAFALDSPGGFALRRDYRDRRVLVTGRAIADTPWVLVRKIDRAEALGDSDARLRRLLTVLILGIALITAGALVVWRHGASRRASAAAARYRALATRFEAQEQFVRLVTDSQPNRIFITDGGERYRFANRTAAADAGIAAEDMVGKTVASVLGPDAARRYREADREVRESRTPVVREHRLFANGDIRHLIAEHIPLPANEEISDGVLVVEQDITEVVTERERRERILRQIVRTLVNVVDRRDPNAADHSTRVAELARVVALEMGLDTREVETAEIAGNVMNLGKILVPAEVLTKSEGLTEAEIAQVRDSIQTSADLLEGIEFDGPVVDTLRQVQERWDGAGRPAGLAGEDILITARIVAVANSFVALTSPRAHRAGRTLDETLELLLGEVGRTYDRRAVAALVNYMDNRGGRTVWSGAEASA